MRLISGQPRGSAEVERSLYGQFARVAMAFASPVRVALVEVLCQGERSVSSLAQELGAGLKNTSAQLRQLQLAGLVAPRRNGRNVYYRLADEDVCHFLAALRDLTRHRLPEVDSLIRQHFEVPPEMEPMPREVLLARLRTGSVLVLDVRPREEYLAGHIPHARSVPLAELESFLATLTPEVEIVAYCRGPYCVLAPQAVEACRLRGLTARRLDGGLPEWRLAGLPVTVGTEEAA